MNALKRRIFEIPPNATHVSWCYGLTELPESVDDALSSKLDEAEDSGEAKPDTAALSLFRDGGFVYFNPDRLGSVSVRVITTVLTGFPPQIHRRCISSGAKSEKFDLSGPDVGARSFTARGSHVLE